MKNLKFTFLFFVVCSLFLLASCSPKEELKASKTSDLDSISVFLKEMKNDSLAFETRLQSADKALQWINSTKDSLDTKEILLYKIYLFGNLMQYDSAIYTSKGLLQKAIKKNDSASISQSYYQLAYYNDRKQQKDSAYYYYNLVKNEYLKYNDSITNGRILNEIAGIERIYGDYNASEFSGLLALNYLGDKDSLSSANVYTNWAISSKLQGQVRGAC
mgnify:FL=1